MRAAVHCYSLAFGDILCCLDVDQQDSDMARSCARRTDDAWFPLLPSQAYAHAYMQSMCCSFPVGCKTVPLVDEERTAFDPPPVPEGSEAEPEAAPKVPRNLQLEVRRAQSPA